MTAVLLDAWRVLSARPFRTVSQGLGIAIGACVFLLALGFGQTMAHQVDSSFDVARATTVTVTAKQGALALVTGLDDVVTPDALARARAIPGVAGASVVGVVPDQDMTALVGGGDGVPATARLDVAVADRSLAATTEAVRRGAFLANIDATYARRVIVLGRGAASRLGVTAPGAQVRLRGVDLTVIGIVTDVARAPELLNSAIVGPRLRSEVLPTARMRPDIVVATRPGAAQVVAMHLAATLNPSAPGLLDVSAPPSPDDLRQGVSRDVRLLVLGGAGVVLAVGVFAVSNLMVLSIASRVGEIGMRRAMGARVVDIVLMVLVECLLVGLFAGICGSVFGVWILLGVCMWQGWTPIFDVWIVPWGIAAGCVGGGLGGVVPAFVGARVQPATALRA